MPHRSRIESAISSGPTPFPRPAAALRAALREGYGAGDLRADLLAGLVVGVVALPLAMALAIASGVPPQHGLYTAIVAGAVIALLGGSRTQVSGPTAAFVVVLAPIAARHGIAGLLVSTMMAGAILVALGAARMGRLIQFIPHPVTTGFTAGIAVVLATLQLRDLLGLQVVHMPEAYLERVAVLSQALPTARWPDAAIGALTLALLLLWPRIDRRLPAPLVALTAASAVAALLGAWADGFEVATIGSRFSYELDGRVLPGIPRLPPVPVLPWHLPGVGGAPFHLSWETLRELAPSAFAIAALGAIESLLSAVVADGMTGTRHDPDAELIAQGAGNLLAPLFGGIAATGAIARTATGIRAGARSPIAALAHAGLVLAAVLLLAPVLAYLPMASLAALLLLVAWNMSDVKHFVHVCRVAPRSDVVVLVTCFLLTVIFDMVVSVTAGVVLAALLFMRRMAEISGATLTTGEHPALPEPLGRGVVLYQIAGPLFFGAAEKAVGSLHAIGAGVRAVILDLGAVPAIDATGLVALQSALGRLERDCVLVVLARAQPQPARVLERAGIRPEPGRLTVCATLEEAVARAREALGGQPADPEARPSPSPAGAVG